MGVDLFFLFHLAVGEGVVSCLRCSRAVNGRRAWRRRFVAQVFSVTAGRIVSGGLVSCIALVLRSWSLGSLDGATSRLLMICLASHWSLSTAQGHALDSCTFNAKLAQNPHPV